MSWSPYRGHRSVALLFRARRLARKMPNSHRSKIDYTRSLSLVCLALSLGCASVKPEQEAGGGRSGSGNSTGTGGASPIIVHTDAGLLTADLMEGSDCSHELRLVV